MTATHNKSGVESDYVNNWANNPLTDPKTDILGYAPFAKHLADSICKMAFPEGFVIAIYGGWGSGKSTLLNFIIDYLKQKPESEQPIIVPFNPWLFSGQEDITRHFFNQLQTIFSDWKSVPKGLRERITDLANVVAEIPLPYIQAGGAVAKLFDNKEKDTSDLKEEVEDTLQEQHPRIVVTVDDIDRLTAEEIRQLFRVITAFPNFNNVVYLLMFDKEIVIKALAETQDISGEAYLEKFVQVPFKLPLPDKTSLRKLLFSKLNAILADTPKQLFDQIHWGNVYFEGIDHFITSIRDVARLSNHLSVTYPAVKGEVNAVDFIAIESLRIFCPIIYKTIRKNHKSYVETDAKTFLSSTLEEFKHLHNFWLAQLQDQDKEPVKRLLLQLFPKLETVWNNNYFSQPQDLTWHNQKRICNLEIFPIYFRLVLPEGELSKVENKAILAQAKDAKVFGENLVELANQKRPDGTTQVRAFLERLEDYNEQEIPWDYNSSIVQALFDVGDRLLRSEDEPCGMFDFGNNIRIHRIIWQLLRRIETPERFEVVKAAISNGNALSIIAQEVVFFGQQQSNYSQESSTQEWVFNVQQIKELEKIALKKVQDAAQQNLLLQTPNLPQILACWQEWKNEEEVKQWVQKVIRDDQGLVEFLEKFIKTNITQSVSDLIPKKNYKLDAKQLETYLDSSSAIERLRNLDENYELTQKQKTAIEQFIDL